MHSLDDTIAAVASPPGGAARGIVRLSGPGLRQCLERYFRPDPYVALTSITVARAFPGLLWLPGFASSVPCDLYLWPSKRSYTGQSVAELHTLGSPPILEAVLRAVCAGGARMAQPGEFTLRAFLAGRIDLTQAEAVLGVIDAADPAELDAALAQLAGGLAVPLHGLREMLLDLLAHVEAGFDFADEDLPFITQEQLAAQLDDATAHVERLVGRMSLRSETLDWTRVVLRGRPNTGKSSLFNSLTHRAGALVSDQPGTTRDYLTATLDLDGVKCQLIDTAGIDCVEDALSSDHATGSDPAVRQAAQAASLEQSRRAHVTLLCIDSTRPPDAWEQRQLQGDAGGRLIVVLTKTDLGSRDPWLPTGPFPQTVIGTSSLNCMGFQALRDAVRRAILHARGPQGDVVAGTAVRASESLRLAAECLRRARQMAHRGQGEELIAVEVRVALDELGKVVGAVYTEDVLDRIFSRFCVGK